MSMKSSEHTDVSKDCRINEFKSINGICFKAKLIGNVEVTELKGKTVAENAMARLKFDLSKKRQHKTKINIYLKWDGIYVHLCEGGQELLHCFILEQISFVWKNSSDDRAVGIIITELSADKQSTVAKFFAYKTERPAIPLIMAMKELFILRTSETSESSNESPPQTVKDDIEHVQPVQDLLDLDFKSAKTDSAEVSIFENANDNFSLNWTNISDIYKNTISPAVPTQVSSHPSYNLSPWVPYPQVPDATQRSFNMSWPTYTFIEPNGLNPFLQTSRIETPIKNSSSSQNRMINSNQKSSSLQSQLEKHHNKDLFSDLIPPEYSLEGSAKLQKHNSNSNDQETKKLSLVDIKNQKEIKMDFSALDNGTNGKPVVNQNLSTTSLTTPLFQID